MVKVTFLVSGADRAEMCHRRAARNRTHRESLSSYYILYGNSPSRHPLSGVFAPLLAGTLCLCPLTSSLPVSNSDRSVGGRSWRRKRRKTRVERRPMGVSAHNQTAASAASASPPPTTNLSGTFSSYFQHLSPWEIWRHRTGALITSSFTCQLNWMGTARAK